MANKPVVFDDDNPEWTKGDFERARSGSEVLPAEVPESIQTCTRSAEGFRHVKQVIGFASN